MLTSIPSMFVLPKQAPSIACTHKLVLHAQAVIHQACLCCLNRHTALQALICYAACTKNEGQLQKKVPMLLLKHGE